MTALARVTSPIRVRRSWKRFKVMWVWTCDDHPRFRGYHHAHRMVDHYRKRYGKPPDAHPWERAMAGAIEHWHRFHDPAGPCSSCTHARRATPRRTA